MRLWPVAHRVAEAVLADPEAVIAGALEEEAVSTDALTLPSVRASSPLAWASVPE
jgi:hypothetical protein